MGYWDDYLAHGVVRLNDDGTRTVSEPGQTPDYQAYRDAIASIESAGSGGYKALGPRTRRGDRAYGRYQIMGANVGPWSQAALGYSLTPQQLLANPAAQDALFDYQFGNYLRQYGNPQDAASAWFTGRPLSSGANARDLYGTTGSGYVARFNRALGNPSPTQTASPQPTVAPNDPLTASQGYGPNIAVPSPPSQQGTTGDQVTALLNQLMNPQQQPQNQGILGGLLGGQKGQSSMLNSAMGALSPQQGQVPQSNARAEAAAMGQQMLQLQQALAQQFLTRGVR